MTTTQQLLAQHQTKTLNLMADWLERSSPVMANALRAEAAKPEPKIVTDYVNPPIPFRGCDWSATLDGYEPGDLIGRGRTEADAIADLKFQIEESAQ